ncbi:MAG: 50S ribosomal protein L23 [Rhodobacteraceae bacterium]|nr:50S ribosomal protein L23 [Paracoccaceae bacterium]
MSVKAEHYDVIRKPIITEKATLASENGAIVFEVAHDSNKPQIKEAVKTKRFRGIKGTRKDVKKAYVTLEEGNSIDVTTGL